MKIPCSCPTVPFIPHIIIFTFLLLQSPPPNNAYQINDPINLSIRTINPQTFKYEQREALRSQLPLFGILSKYTLSLPLKTNQNSRNDKYDNGLSLSFADGSMSIPWYSLVRTENSRKNEVNILQTLIINFVYTSDGGGGGGDSVFGGGGEIHSVSSHPVYVPKEKNDFEEEEDEVQVEVMYVWLEEASVDIQGGTIVMFVGTLIATVVIVVLVCCSDDGDEDDEEEVIKEERKGGGLYGSGDDGNYYQQQQQYGYQGGSGTTSAAYRRGGAGGGGGKWD